MNMELFLNSIVNGSKLGTIILVRFPISRLAFTAAVFPSVTITALFQAFENQMAIVARRSEGEKLQLNPHAILQESDNPEIVKEEVFNHSCKSLEKQISTENY